MVLFGITTISNFIFDLHSKKDNIEFMPIDNASEVVDEPCESLLLRYQTGLETSVGGSDFVFNSVQFCTKATK